VRFPPRSNPLYPPIISATFTQARKTRKAIGFDRGVIVHSAIYGNDHRLLLHALESLDNRDRYRGVGIVDDRVSDNELERMHEAGVRGARFNFVRFLSLDQREAEVRRSMARLRELKTVWRETRPGARELWEAYLGFKKKNASSEEIENELQSGLKICQRPTPQKPSIDSGTSISGGHGVTVIFLGPAVAALGMR